MDERKRAGEPVIDLHEVWSAVKRRPWVVLGVALPVWAVVVYFNFQAPPVYASRTTIRIGAVARFAAGGRTEVVESLETAEPLALRLGDRYPRAATGGGAYWHSITPHPESRGGGTVIVTVRATDPTAAETLARRIGDETSAEQNVRFDALEKERLARLASLRARLVEMASLRDELTRRLGILSDKGSAAAVLALVEKYQLISQMDHSEIELTASESAGKGPAVRRTEAYVSAPAFVGAGTARQIQNLLVGLALAILLAAVLAVVVDYLARARGWRADALADA